MWHRLTYCMALMCVGVATPAFTQEGAPGTDAQPLFELTLPLGLDAGAQYIPANNPLTAEKIALGRQLYFDKRLSADNSVSCASAPKI